MKHLFSTIAFALFLSINHVAAFSGSDMMEQNAKAQVDKKAEQPNVAKKTQADAKNKQKAPDKPNVNTNDAQLMTEEANADRQGNRGRASGGQQQQQQEEDPLHQDADTATVDTTTATNVQLSLLRKKTMQTKSLLLLCVEAWHALKLMLKR